MSYSKRSRSSGPTSTGQRVTLGTIAAVVIAVIVFVTQLIGGNDSDNEKDNDKESNKPVATDVVQGVIKTSDALSLAGMQVMMAPATVDENGEINITVTFNSQGQIEVKGMMTTTVDANGKFVFNNVAAGRYAIEFVDLMNTLQLVDKAEGQGVDLGTLTLIKQADGSYTLEQPVTTPGATVVANVPDTLRAIPGGYDGGWFQLYFADPSAFNGTYRGAPIENSLVAAIDNAQSTIDAAFYEIDSVPITEALIRAHQNNVAVRIVTDDEGAINKPNSTIHDLIKAGIEVVDDEDPGSLMHNKFFVIDGLYVWTGATNVTEAGMYENNNNAMLIRSSRLASAYDAEFEEMFTNHAFGSLSPTTGQREAVTIEGTQIEVYFESEEKSPTDAPTRLIELLDSAQTVQFMAFSFTDSLEAGSGRQAVSVMDEMIKQATSGQLAVSGIIEVRMRQYVKPMYCAGIDVRQDGNPSTFHHKVFILDESIVVMGSFNFSASAAEDNDENMLVIHSPAIAQAFLEEFAKRWQESVPIPDGTFDC